MQTMKLRSAAVALLLIVCASAAQAQSPLGVDVRAMGAIPTGDIEDLKTGFGFGAALSYRVMPHVSVYAGWDFVNFQNDVDNEADEVDIEDTGYNAGLMFEHPITPALNVWLLGGALYKHIEVEDQDGNEVDSADHGFGFEAGAGISFRLSDRISLRPGVRYRSFSPDYGENVEGADISYIAIEVGAAFRF